MILKRCFIIAIFLCSYQLNSFAIDSDLKQRQTPVYVYQVIKIYPHDTTSFTEGLVYHDGYLYESTGLNGQSKLRKIDLSTGKVLQQIELEPQYFGEGIAILHQHIYQLTYQSHIGFVYDLNSFKLQNTFHYNTEGWGLTTDGKQLIMSDGTATISFIDPVSFHVMRKITVHGNRENISYVNELEYIDNKIYANVWQTDLIAVISPQDGKILGWLDLHSLNHQPLALRMFNVLNGIAYDAQRKLLLVTGKNWPNIYAIKIQGLNI